MKKILLAFDGDHYPAGSLQFVKKLNELDAIFLTAAFLPQTQLANLWSYSGGGLHGESFVPLIEEDEATKVQANIRRFESFCYGNRIDFQVHKDYFDFAIPSLERESHYADLMILSSEVFYSEAGNSRPNEYLEEILHLAKCPVIVVPEKFEFPQSNLLAYDGSESSIYAIKQFAYLFPYLTTNKTLLMHAVEKGIEEFPKEDDITQLVNDRFPNVQFALLEGDSKDFFANWCWDMSKAILISGAYGRSGLSMLFRKSFIRGVISDHKLPVFIAHK